MNSAIFLILAIAVIAWLVYEIRRAPIEDFDRSEYDADNEAADECIAASRPAPLDRPHVRGNTAYGKDIV